MNRRAVADYDMTISKKEAVGRYLRQPSQTNEPKAVGVTLIEKIIVKFRYDSVLTYTV